VPESEGAMTGDSKATEGTAPKSFRARWFVLAGLGLTVGLLVVAVEVYRRAEPDLVIESSYKTRAETVAPASEVSRWLPNFLPGSAVDIHEKHDLDTNESWGLFRSDEAGMREIRALFREIVPPFSVRLPKRPFRDWPIDEEGLTCWESLRKGGVSMIGAYDDHRAPQRRFLVALLPGRLEVVFWSVREDPVRAGECKGSSRN
jgi:hypothetical protein